MIKTACAKFRKQNHPNDALLLTWAAFCHILGPFCMTCWSAQLRHSSDFVAAATASQLRRSSAARTMSGRQGIVTPSSNIMTIYDHIKCVIPLHVPAIFRSLQNTVGGSNIEILRFAPGAMKTSSQCLFVLIDVRSNEKTAHRVVILAQNADKHGRSRDARPKPFFKKKVRNAAFRGSAGPVPSGYGNMDHLSI